MTASSEDVVTVAGLIEAILIQRTADKRAGVLEAASDCATIFGRHASEVRRQAADRLRLGTPPSMRQIVGVSDLEVPLNRALAWVFDEFDRGASARRGLLALAELLGFTALVADIESGQPLTLYAESCPDADTSGRQPDFLIGSPHAAALVENKVWSPESGPNQYADYLSLLRRWADTRDARAYLLVRDEGRATPPGWERTVTHRELAGALRPLATDASISFWDRVVYSLIVTDLDPDPHSDRLRDIEYIVAGDHPLPEVTAAARLSQLLRHPTIDPTNGSY